MAIDLNKIKKESKSEFKMISPKTNKGVGRPKKDNNREYQVKALLTKEEFEILEKFCELNDISKSKAISNFINTLKGE